MKPLVVPQCELFQECAMVLEESLRPMHYRDLSLQAIKRLGYRESQVSMFRVIEDVREKMLVKGRFGTGYLGKPHCLAFKKQWFKTAQLEMFHVDSVLIPSSAMAGFNGALEALMRAPHMLQRSTRANLYVRNQAIARGLVIEKHVAAWFRASWPEFFCKPNNQSNWRKPCPHDFKLKVGGRTLEIDVAGPNRHGVYGNVFGKKRVDLHLLCRMVNDGIVWEGVVTGRNFNAHIVPENSLSPKRMVVWLNTLKSGHEYDLIAQAVKH